MKLSTKGRYTVRAMIDLAIQSRDRPALVKDISKRQGISNLYLEQLFTQLKTSGLVRSYRGPNGGFTLAKSPSQIRVIDIVQAMEGSTAPVDCVDDVAVCSRADFCATRKVWVEVKKAVDKVLVSTTLKDLVEWEARYKVDTHEVSAGPDLRSK